MHVYVAWIGTVCIIMYLLYMCAIIQDVYLYKFCMYCHRQCFVDLQIKFDHDLFGGMLLLVKPVTTLTFAQIFRENKTYIQKVSNRKNSDPTELFWIEKLILGCKQSYFYSKTLVVLLCNILYI